jgi:peptidoglycan hydrolase-like protein with peptidoglycan-binding domain
LSGLGSVRVRIIALAGVIVVLLGAGLWIAMSHAKAQSTAGGATGHQAGAAKDASKAKVPLKVMSVTPAAGTVGVNGAAPIKITFSTALAADSSMPTVRPRIAGSWRQAGTDAIEFVPARGFVQHARVRVAIPAGMTSAGGGQLATASVVRFRVGAYSRARLAQLLAQLGYLPLTWAPASGQTAPSLGTGLSAQVSAAYTPPSGSFTWKAGYPLRLRQFWNNGADAGMIIHGAVMAFESDHGMTMDGVAGPAVWRAILRSAGRDDANRHGYTYAVASQHAPEYLSVWHNGRRILHTLANTGIPAAPTTVGTAAVYLKYSFQIMRGTNPDGSKYADPVSWVSYFRAGEAVHYFPRGSYGFQQSLGCVELPMAQAHYIWPYMTYGTLVTVTGA